MSNKIDENPTAQTFVVLNKKRSSVNRCIVYEVFDENFSQHRKQTVVRCVQANFSYQCVFCFPCKPPIHSTDCCKLNLKSSERSCCPCCTSLLGSKSRNLYLFSTKCNGMFLSVQRVTISIRFIPLHRESATDGRPDMN
jgi:hypothetical protein